MYEMPKTCWTCEKSYHGGESLCCGEGSSVEPKPFWATEAAFLRVLVSGTPSGRERADDIDHSMATDCKAFKQSDKEIPASALIDFPGWVVVRKDNEEILRQPEPPTLRDDFISGSRSRMQPSMSRPQLRDNEHLVELVDGTQIIETHR